MSWWMAGDAASFKEVHFVLVGISAKKDGLTGAGELQ